MKYSVVGLNGNGVLQRHVRTVPNDGFLFGGSRKCVNRLLWQISASGDHTHLHAEHKPWVMRPDKAFVFCGGHFDGGTILHWARGTGGKGALLSGDVIQVVPDRKNVSYRCIRTPITPPAFVGH